MNLKFLDIINRLKKLRNLSTDSEIAELLQLKKANFSSYKDRNSIPFDAIFELCERDHLSMDWVLTGETSRAMPGFLTPGLSVKEAEGVYDGDFVFIPRVSGNISAGGGLVPDETVEMKIAFRRDWITRKGNPQNMSMIRVAGDSMDPTLQSGDLVLVDHGRNYVDPHGGLYAISMNNMIMIKRLQMIPTTGRVRIISDNSRYEPIDADPKQVNVNGKVIWFGRELER